MTHVGEELALGRVGGYRLGRALLHLALQVAVELAEAPFAVAQPLFGLFELGDVGQQGLKAGGFPRGIADQGDRDLGIGQPAVLSPVALFDDPGAGTTPQTLEQGLLGGPVHLQHELAQVPADQSRAGLADDLTIAIVDADQMAVEVTLADAGQALLDEGAQPLLIVEFRRLVLHGLAHGVDPGRHQQQDDDEAEQEIAGVVQVGGETGQNRCPEPLLLEPAAGPWRDAGKAIGDPPPEGGVALADRPVELAGVDRWGMPEFRPETRLGEEVFGRPLVHAEHGHLVAGRRRDQRRVTGVALQMLRAGLQQLVDAAISVLDADDELPARRRIDDTR